MTVRSLFFPQITASKKFFFYHFIVSDKVSKLQPGSPVKRKRMNCLNEHLDCLLYQIKLSEYHTISVFTHTEVMVRLTGSCKNAGRKGSADFKLWFLQI